MIDEEKRLRKGSLQLERGGVWTMRVSVGGKTCSRSSGVKDQAKARAKLARFVREMERACASGARPGPLAGEWTRYRKLAGSERLTPAMSASRRRAWRKFAEWMGAAYPDVRAAHGVTRQMAEEYMAAFGADHSAVTFNLCAGCLKNIFRVLLKSGPGPAGPNPMDGVPRRFADTYSRRELTADEVRRVIIAAGREGGEWPLLFAIAVYTGLRLGDCCRLRWENIDLARGIIQVVPQKTRRHACGRVVTIPLHDRLTAALKAAQGESRGGFVLPGTAEKYAAERWRISKGIDLVFDGAGIVKSVQYKGRSRLTPSATFHSLRHSFVSFAANAGVPLAVVQAIVGHTSAAMTRHYYHANEPALRRAVEAIPSFTGDGGETADAKAGSAPAGTATGCAGAARRQPSIARRLASAKKLLSAGLISVQEYSDMRERILAAV